MNLYSCERRRTQINAIVTIEEPFYIPKMINDLIAISPSYINYANIILVLMRPKRLSNVNSLLIKEKCSVSHKRFTLDGTLREAKTLETNDKWKSLLFRQVNADCKTPENSTNVIFIVLIPCCYLSVFYHVL